MKISCVLFILLIVVLAQAQNLVPNPSFEEINVMPCQLYVGNEKKFKQIFNGIFQDWEIPTSGTIDPFSLLADKDCVTYPSTDLFGAPPPKNGNNMVGIYNNVTEDFSYREYIQVKLREKLSIGSNYLCGFYIARSTKFKYATNNFGMAFSEEKISSDSTTVLALVPQVNSPNVMESPSWVLCINNFESTQQSEYLTIGNFYSNKETKIKPETAVKEAAYYFIDSVFVEAINDLVIPDVITPNGDCCNEKFEIENLQFDRWTLKVLNR